MLLLPALNKQENMKCEIEYPCSPRQKLFLVIKKYFSSVFVYVIVLLFFHVRNKYGLEVHQYAVSRPSGMNKGCAGVEQTQADGRRVAGRGVH